MSAERVAPLVPADLLEARIADYRKTEAVLTMRLIRYGEALKAAGVEPPDDTEDELLQMWRNAQAVLTTASEFVAHLGSAKELLA